MRIGPDLLAYRLATAVGLDAVYHRAQFLGSDGPRTSRARRRLAGGEDLRHARHSLLKGTVHGPRLSQLRENPLVRAVLASGAKQIAGS